MRVVESWPEPPPHVFWAGRTTEMLPMAAAHAHSQLELNLMLRGEATYAFCGREITVRAGEFILFWGAVPHRTLVVAGGTRFVCLYVPIEMFLALPLSAALREAVLSGGMIAAREALEADWPQRLRDELISGDAKLAELGRQELALRLRRVDLTGWSDRAGDGPDAYRRLPGGNAKVCAMAQFLTAHATGPVAAASVAAAVGLHPNYAMALFKSALGMTIGEYLTRYRLYLAQSMLLAEGGAVATVAFDAGFGSVSRFHDAFRRRFGTSPARFRRIALRSHDGQAGAAACPPR